MKRRLAIPFASLTLVVGAAACVDLFHSTEFDTLCTRDPSACGDDGSAKKDGSTPEAGPTITDFCAAYTPAMAREKAQKACAWIGSCLGSRENSSYADCFVRALAAYDCDFNPSLRPRDSAIGFWDCLSNVDSCDSVAQCVFGTSANVCDATGTFTTCSTGSAEPKVVIGCGDETTPIGMEPCALRGEKCTTLDPSTAICTGALGKKCDETVAPKCSEGRFAVHCAKVLGINVDKGTDCSLIGGGECFADDAGPGCTASPGTADSCETSTKVTCNGKTAESCVNGKAVHINCGSLGQTCAGSTAVSADPISACTSDRDTEECTDAEDGGGPRADICDGDTLKSCRGGTWFTAECLNLGFNKCRAAAAERWAACAK